MLNDYIIFFNWKKKNVYKQRKLQSCTNRKLKNVKKIS